MRFQLLASIVIAAGLTACTSAPVPPEPTTPTAATAPANAPTVPPLPPTPTAAPGSTATPTPQTAPPQPGITASTPGDVIGAERTLKDYFQWLSEGRSAEAHTLFSPDYQQRNPQQDAAPAAGSVSFNVTRAEPIEVGANRIAFRAEIEVSGSTEGLNGWNPGANTRYVEVVRTAQGWRINDISTEPFASSAASAPTTSAPVTVAGSGIRVDAPLA